MSVCILLWIIVSDCVLVIHSGSSMPVSHPVIVGFMFFSNVLFLFSACFHAFHRNLSFIDLDSYSYNKEMSVTRSCISAWHSAENIRRSPVDRREWPAYWFLSSMDTGCIFFVVMLHLSWLENNISSFTQTNSTLMLDTNAREALKSARP